MVSNKMKATKLRSKTSLDYEQSPIFLWDSKASESRERPRKLLPVWRRDTGREAIFTLAYVVRSLASIDVLARRKSSEVFGTSSDIFGYHRSPTKNPGTLRGKCRANNLKKVGRYIYFP